MAKILKLVTNFNFTPCKQSKRWKSERNHLRNTFRVKNHAHQF